MLVEPIIQLVLPVIEIEGTSFLDKWSESRIPESGKRQLVESFSRLYQDILQHKVFVEYLALTKDAATEERRKTALEKALQASARAQGQDKSYDLSDPAKFTRAKETIFQRALLCASLAKAKIDIAGLKVVLDLPSGVISPLEWRVVILYHDLERGTEGASFNQIAERESLSLTAITTRYRFGIHKLASPAFERSQGISAKPEWLVFLDSLGKPGKKKFA